MKERKHYLYLSNLETNIVLLSLIELRNSLINEGRYPDCVNDIIEQIFNAPIKKVWRQNCKNCVRANTNAFFI